MMPNVGNVSATTKLVNSNFLWC